MMENVEIKFSDMEDLYRDLETESVKTPSVNRSWQTHFNNENYNMFYQMKHVLYNDNRREPSESIKILEIGTGAGFSSLFWLSVDSNLEVTTFDKTNKIFIESNMRKLESRFTHRFQYDTLSSLEYNPEDDPNYKKYDIVCIDGDIDTLEHDIKIAKKLEPNYIWVMNSDSVGHEETSKIISDHLEDLGYDYFHNLMYEITDYTNGYDETFPKTINSSLYIKTR